MAALPPLNKIAIIGTWIETVLYGVNCVLYGLCMLVLLRGGKTAPLRRMLLSMSTILFLLGTAYSGASLRQLLDAFVYAPANVPDYSTTYWLRIPGTPRVLKGFLFGTLVLAQDTILIWRLYVVFLCNWRVTILPIILVVGCVGSAYAATIEATRPNHGFDSPLLTSLTILSWTFGFTVNTSVTGLIAVRLWQLGRRMTLGTTSTNRFAHSAYFIVESGAISTVSNAAMLALFAAKNAVALFYMDIAAQVTVLAPLLIIVQFGYMQVGQDHVSTGNISQTVFKAPGAKTFRLDIPRDPESSGQDLLDIR